ncbi:hypothetical protein [Xylophilus ampelinus]|uniref:Uncharacterized protein n=1 Tax=Xylophilus ampelinus TaxID=54067 RepID=A0A318SH56_9BURK|nr:hypothetical protein [Xylophilus ampelinus]PYE74210.1 hypothetical protein DFQ15_1281 [Xylophilus ampelinus]
MKLHEENEPLFITEEMAAEMAAAGYEFKPPCHARTKSVRDLYGWQPGEILEEAIARHQRKQCSAANTTLLASLPHLVVLLVLSAMRRLARTASLGCVSRSKLNMVFFMGRFQA